MSDTQAPLLRDLIDIPERVHQGDFVLKLSEGVSDAHAAETVANYVVTDQLRRAFDDALGLHPARDRRTQKRGLLPAWLVRLRQKPFHGGAEPAACRQCPGPRDPRTGARWWIATMPGPSNVAS